MQKIAGLSLFLISSLFCSSQDPIVRTLQAESIRTVAKDINDTTWKTWKLGGSYNFSVGQGSLSNWAAGGDDFSLTISTGLNLYGLYKKKKHSWDNTANLNFGYIKTTSLGSRKNDDRFDILTKYGYSLSPKLNMATLANLRSQIFKGYTYKDGSKFFASAFLSPGYVIVSQGLDYKPTKTLSVFVSPVTSRWVIVKDDSLSLKGGYGVDAGTHSTNQLGAFATVSYQQHFNKYISYKGRIDLFSNYRTNALNTDVYMTNSLSAKIGKLFAFSWNIDMIYDDDVRMFGKNLQSPALQLKSVIGVGLQVKI